MSVLLPVLKFGRSSKFRVKFPCSPQTDGVADAELTVLLATVEVLEVEPDVARVAELAAAELEAGPTADANDWDVAGELARLEDVCDVPAEMEDTPVRLGPAADAVKELDKGVGMP